MRNERLSIRGMLILLLLPLIFACGKKSPAPDQVETAPVLQTALTLAPEENPKDSLDPASLVALHRDIFSVSCAISGCHDGHFEPDFRSPMSTWNTTVFQPVIKNNAAKKFRFRIVPGDTSRSVLYERITNCCFVNVDDRMPQRNIGEPLPQAEINRIGMWIVQGAPDIFGEPAAFEE